MMDDLKHLAAKRFVFQAIEKAWRRNGIQYGSVGGSTLPALEYLTCLNR
jgi:hypothetical protein